MMDIQYRNNKPILIYFMTRGNAQIIRCVLLEIGVDFEQIFVQNNGHLDPEIIEKYQLDLKNLPYFIHNGLPIFGVFPIIKYCCLKFGRPDLLGRNIEDSIHITQTMVKETRSNGASLHFWFKGMREVHQKQLGQAGIIALIRKIIQSFKKDHVIDHLKLMFNKSKGFIYGNLTVIDFVMFQKSFYSVNTLVCQMPEVEHMIQYYNFFVNTNFYRKHEKSLNKYKVFFPETDKVVNDQIKKTWIGDLKFITCD